MTTSNWIVPKPDKIPASLRERRQWVVWRAVVRHGKLTKVPFTARGGTASTTSPSTWSSFEEVWRAYRDGSYEGIGYVFIAADPFAGIDLDKCRDATTGALEPWANEIVQKLGSYTEVSPSGTGLHVIVQATLPPGRRRKGRIEMYDSGRYFAMTGVVVAGAASEVEERQAALEAMHLAELGGGGTQAVTSPPDAAACPLPSLADAALLERARHARNGAKFKRLFDHGDATAYASASEADFALCALLAFWVGKDAAAIDRLFRRSALMRPKWDEARGKSTWGAETIERILARPRGRNGGPGGRTAARGGPKVPGTEVRQPRAAGGSAEVLVPGVHRMSSGEYLEVGTDDFTREVLSALGGEVLYRMDFVVGEIVGDPGKRRFVPLSENRLRILIDERMRLGRWVKRPGWEDYVFAFVPCGRDHAALVLSEAGVSPRVRELQQLVNYPVYLPGFELVIEGWNSGGGVFYDEPPELAGLTPRSEGALDTLDDLVTDFVLKDEASRQNTYAAMLTRVLRSAILGPIPFFLVMSPLPRTGKGKLIDTAAGYAITGEAVVPLQLGGDEAETEKRITAEILGGSTAAHFDNVPVGIAIDSPSLASLATAWPRWGGRRLGESRNVHLANRLLVFLSGNNPRATREVVMRSVPIVLQPKDEHPELRPADDYRHAEPFAYALERRRQILEALIGIVEAWKAAGRPPPPSHVRMGGFERWLEAVCGALWHAGGTQTLANYAAWCACADDESADADVLIDAWAVRHGDQPITATQILELVRAAGVFRDVLARPTEAGQLVALARKVLTPLTDRPVRGWIVRRTPSGSASTYHLARANP